MSGAARHTLARLRRWLHVRLLRVQLAQLQAAEQHTADAMEQMAEDLALLRMERRTVQARLTYATRPAEQPAVPITWGL